MEQEKNKSANKTCLLIISEQINSRPVVGYRSPVYTAMSSKSALYKYYSGSDMAAYWIQLIEAQVLRVRGFQIG